MFTMYVTHVYVFSDGMTVFVGPVDRLAAVAVPCTAELFYGERLVTTVVIDGERRRPPALPAGYAILTASDAIIEKDSMRSGGYVLRCQLPHTNL